MTSEPLLRTTRPIAAPARRREAAGRPRTHERQRLAQQTIVATVERTAGPVLFMALGLCLTLGCGAAHVDRENTLPSISELGPDFFYRQTIDGRRDGTRFFMNVVVQKEASQLTIVGLTPMGTRAFAISQRENQNELEIQTSTDLPFPADRIVRDLHDALAKTPPGAPTLENATRADGTHRFEHRGNRVTETWSSGRLRRRLFLRRAHRRTEIRYEGGWDLRSTPPALWLESTRPSYTLRIETLPTLE